jgi:hypothetical protein
MQRGFLYFSEMSKKRVDNKKAVYFVFSANLSHLSRTLSEQRDIKTKPLQISFKSFTNNKV